MGRTIFSGRQLIIISMNSLINEQSLMLGSNDSDETWTFEKSLNNLYNMACLPRKRWTK